MLLMPVELLTPLLLLVLRTPLLRTPVTLLVMVVFARTLPISRRTAHNLCPLVVFVVVLESLRSVQSALELVAESVVESVDLVLQAPQVDQVAQAVW